MSVACLMLSMAALAGEPAETPPPGAIPQPEATLTPPQAPVVVKASAKDGFRVESADGNWGLQLGGLFWANFTDTVNTLGNTPHFSVPNARFMLRATIFRPWITFFFQPELAGVPRVLDMEVAIQPWEQLGLKVGQFVPAYSRSFLTPVPKLQFQGFGSANNFFRPDRQAGAMVFGAFLNRRLEYFAGVFDGNGTNRTSNDNPHMMWNWRIAGTLFGTPPSATQHVKYDETAHLAGDAAPTLMLGIDGYVNRVTSALTGLNGGAEVVELQSFSADAAFVWQRFFAQVEGYLTRAVPIVNSASVNTLRTGLDAQAGFFILRSVLEVAGRFSWMHFDNHFPGAWLVQGDGQLNYYVARNNLKVGLRYSAAYTQFQINGYAPGLTHFVWLQLQVWL